MDISPISSIYPLLEILTAFNFAFVASASFLNELNVKLTGSFGLAKTKMKGLGTRVSQIENYLTAALTSKGEVLPALLDRQKELEDLKNRKEILKSEIKKEILKLSASIVFQRFCLFGGIYCVLILFVSSFDSIASKDLFQEILIIFNFLALIYLLWICIPKLYPRKPPITWDVVLAFVFPLVLALILLVIFEGWLGFHCSYDLSGLLKFSILLVASIHYIFYFTKAMISSKRLGREKVEACEKLNIEIGQIAIRLQGNLDPSNISITPSN